MTVQSRMRCSHKDSQRPFHRHSVLFSSARSAKAGRHLSSTCRCQPVKEVQVQPCYQTVTAFAPATVANLGPGFDWIGCAVKVCALFPPRPRCRYAPGADPRRLEGTIPTAPAHSYANVCQGQGDTVRATVLEGQPGKVVINSITGDNGKLTLEPEQNCVGIAALETLKLFPGGLPSCGVALELDKGLPLGSGMGSSAASAAAACWAVNKLFGEPVKKEKLVLAGLQSEAFVSGYHADNIAPALLGGFILVRCGLHSILGHPPDTDVVLKLSSTGLFLARSSRRTLCGIAGDGVIMLGRQHNSAAAEKLRMGATNMSQPARLCHHHAPNIPSSLTHCPMTVARASNNQKRVADLALSASKRAGPPIRWTFSC